MSVVFVFRIIGGIVAGISAFQALSNVVDLPARTPLDLWVVYAVISGSFGIGYLVTPYLTVHPFLWVRHRIHRATPADILAAGVGLAFGLLVGALLAFPLSFLPGYLGRLLPLVASAVLGYFGVVALLTHKQGLLSLLGLGGRVGAEGIPGSSLRTLLLDTSAIIDGRIADVSRTGFLGGKLVVPRFVLDEIQHIADSSDTLRRAKGRRGLEVLDRLRRDEGCPLEISDIDVEGTALVDSKLIRLARRWSCPIITNDFNLSQSAQIQGVQVLNLNQLAQAVRSSVLQGEELAIRVTQEGREPGQGVGFLEDGTMIVVENGRPYLNTEVEVVVTKVLQTSAGRMIFARLKPELSVARDS